MAGLQSCLKSIFITNSLRITNVNVTFHQTVRRRHLMSFTLTAIKKSHCCKKPNVSLNLEYKNLYRYSSTGFITDSKSEKLADGTGDFKPVKTSSDPTGSTSADASLTTQGGEGILKSNEIVIDESLLPPIPEIPVEQSSIQDVLAAASETLSEPTLSSLGLCTYWPSGWIQRLLEVLHVNLDLPWWGSIALVTLSLRILTLPLNIKSRKNAVNLSNNMPQIQLLQIKINESRINGNYFDTARYCQELQHFIKDKEIITFGSFLPALAQMPIFLSMFWGLRSMTNLPVESMQTGGLLWFMDLTNPDPYYVLPLLITGTMSIIIETGAEGASVSSVSNVWMKWGLRVMPFILLPVTIKFSSAIQCYWVVSNAVALIQVLLLKQKVISSYLGIPAAVKYDKSKLPEALKKRKGINEFKDSMTNMKILREIEDRERLNTITFEKAGTGPVPRTFKRNPTNVKATVKASGK